ncbi:MAG: thiol:disulfide interchange protein DsbA/DsbL [Oceanobacter sp.]
MFASIKYGLNYLLLVGIAALSAQAMAFEAGVDYVLLPKPVAVMADDNIYVEEAFWYGCPHCYDLESIIVPWSEKLPDDVSFEKIPALFGRAWVAHAQLFYTLDVLGAPESVHSDVFHAIHKGKQRLLTPDEQRDFVVSHTGTTKEQFDKVYNSFAVKSKMKQADKRIRSFAITGVPAVIVQGKYLVTAATAGGQHRMTAVIDFLIEKERQALSTAKTQTK